jgi:branched-chain amino acid transport system permease protein
VRAIVGGAGSLLGPLFGTGLLIIFREIISTVWEHYLFAVGAITVLVVMFAPRGLAGAWSDLLHAGTRSKAVSPASELPPVANSGLPKPAADTTSGG